MPSSREAESGQDAGDGRRARAAGQNRSRDSGKRDEPFSDRLERWLESDEPKTLGAMNDVFAEKAFAVTIMLLMFVPALPLADRRRDARLRGDHRASSPRRWSRPGRRSGSPSASGAASSAARSPARRSRSSSGGSVRSSASRGRAASCFFRQRWSSPILGLILIVFAVAAAFAPPFSGLDTLPALGAVLVALSIILEDLIVLAIGVVVGAGGVVLILTIGAALVHYLRKLL